MRSALVLIIVLSLGVAARDARAARKCPGDSVRVGSVCVDRYEASVWRITDKRTIKKVVSGKVTARKQIAGSAAYFNSFHFGDEVGCPDNGGGCLDFYALSLPGVGPAAGLTWFQAAAICRNSGKRLATNQEWQMAALGTPSGLGPCFSPGPPQRATGDRPDCVSDLGAFDMAGNVAEWVADWVPLQRCVGWGPFSNDIMCFGAPSTAATTAAALVRGGGFASPDLAGPFGIDARLPVYATADDVGFRCVREP